MCQDVGCQTHTRKCIHGEGYDNRPGYCQAGIPGSWDQSGWCYRVSSQASPRRCRCILQGIAAVPPRGAPFPCPQEQIGLPLVLVGSPAQRVLQPGVKSTRMNPQKAAHRAHRKLQAMQANERVLHFASLAKNATVFFEMSRSSVTRANSFFSRLIWSISSFPLAFHAANFFFHPYTECWLAPRRCETSATG